ncbi:MAG: hypothetical protein ACRD2I_23945 [Vicinamibacterales bacterium]
MRQAATVIGAGIAAGLAGALALARVTTTFVFGIPAIDPITFASVPAMLAAVALATALIRGDAPQPSTRCVR